MEERFNPKEVDSKWQAIWDDKKYFIAKQDTKRKSTTPTRTRGIKLEQYHKKGNYKRARGVVPEKWKN